MIVINDPPFMARLVGRKDIDNGNVRIDPRSLISPGLPKLIAKSELFAWIDKIVPYDHNNDSYICRVSMLGVIPGSIMYNEAKHVMAFQYIASNSVDIKWAHQSWLLPCRPMRIVLNDQIIDIGTEIIRRQDERVAVSLRD